jgi:hypothetical protein
LNRNGRIVTSGTSTRRFTQRNRRSVQPVEGRGPALRDPGVGGVSCDGLEGSPGCGADVVIADLLSHHTVTESCAIVVPVSCGSEEIGALAPK